MDVWFPVIRTTLESPRGRLQRKFLGGNIIVKKDCVQQKDNDDISWIIHAYFIADEFEDRPIVADLCFRYANQRYELRSALWKNNCYIGHVVTSKKSGRLIVLARVKRLLCELDLASPSYGRNFVIQSFDKRLEKEYNYYVNLVKIAPFAGDLAKSWNEAGVNVAVEELESSLLEAFIETTTKYSDLIILRHTVDKLIIIARRFKMIRILRAIEEYLMDSSTIHWEEKLTMAIQYRMSVLYVQVKNKMLSSPWTILCRVQRAIISQAKTTDKNVELYDTVHKHLRELVMLSSENICIG